MAAKGPKESCGLHFAFVDTISIPLCTQNYSVYSVAKGHSFALIQELHRLLVVTKNTEKTPHETNTL